MEHFKDMHIHTTYSDGSETLKQIIEQLKELRIGTFSITDHDNIDAIKELQATNLEWYPGVEVSTIYKTHKIHLLGYGFDCEDSELLNLLEWIKNQRKLRFYDMVWKAEKEFNVTIPSIQFEQLEQEKTILGRPHLMRYLVERGCGTSHDIMDRIEEKCASDISYRVDLKEAIRVLKKARALVLIAHPKEVEEESHIAFESLIGDLVNLGIDGLEVYHSIHSLEDIRKYQLLTEKYHLLESAGSDYHGPDRKGRALGVVSKNGEKVKKLSLVDELRKRRC